MLMKKNIILQSLAFLALFVGAGCSRESLHSDGQGEGLKITLSCGYDTKATQDGVGNENLIKTVDVFLSRNLIWIHMVKAQPIHIGSMKSLRPAPTIPCILALHLLPKNLIRFMQL